MEASTSSSVYVVIHKCCLGDIVMWEVGRSKHHLSVFLMFRGRNVLCGPQLDVKALDLGCHHLAAAWSGMWLSILMFAQDLIWSILHPWLTTIVLLRGSCNVVSPTPWSVHTWVVVTPTCLVLCSWCSLWPTYYPLYSDSNWYPTYCSLYAVFALHILLLVTLYPHGNWCPTYCPLYLVCALQVSPYTCTCWLM